MARLSDDSAGTTLLRALSIVLFATAAIGGWFKLRHGLNFIDEGTYMLEGWRLAQGGALFNGDLGDILRLYRVFNAGIFWLAPDITLLGFRQLQFAFALGGLLLMVWLLARHVSWWLLLTVSAGFAFVGLDYTGSAPNLSYYTYSHFFLILHIALFVIALRWRVSATRLVLFALSGVALWAVGFSVTPLAAVAAAPVAIWALRRRLPGDTLAFGTMELAVVLAPTALLWGGFLLWHLSAVFDSLVLALAAFQGGATGHGLAFRLTRFAQGLAFAATVAALLVPWMWLRRRNQAFAGPGATILGSLILFLAIRGNFGGLLLPDFWNGWFMGPAWFCGLLLVLSAVAVHGLAREIRTHGLTDLRLELLAVLVPALAMAVCFALVSNWDLLAFGFSAIPLTLGLTVYFCRCWRVDRESAARRHFLIVAVCAPFFAYLMENDWRWTYFDLQPGQLDSRIESGFARGIETNHVFARMVEFIGHETGQRTGPGDFILAYPNVPMVYLLAGRRSASDRNWISGNEFMSVFRTQLERMAAADRLPRLVFRFMANPIFLRTGLKPGGEALQPNQAMTRVHPYDAYVLDNLHEVNVLYTNPAKTTAVIRVFADQ